MPKKEQSNFLFGGLHNRLREGLFIICLAGCIFLLISLLTYHTNDPGWSRTGINDYVMNAGGRVGAWISDFTFFLFGYLAYLFPLLVAYGAWLTFREQQTINTSDFQLLGFRIFGFLLVLVAGDGLANFFKLGGVIGEIIDTGLVTVFNALGAAVILFALLLIGITLFTGLSWPSLLEVVGRLTLGVLQRSVRAVFYGICLIPKCLKSLYGLCVSRKTPDMPFVSSFEILHEEPAEPQRIDPKIPYFLSDQPIPPSREREASRSSQSSPPPRKLSQLPSLSILDPVQRSVLPSVSHERLEAMSCEVEARLLDFGVEAKVVLVHPGPVVTRFELELAPGIKVSKVSGLAKDLARSLSTISVRVVEVIPGKAVIGIEIPNEHREVVRLREILSSDPYQMAASPLSLVLGKDIGGHPVVVDLAKMPHLLVAGTTGSGKSVGLNAMLLSLLFKSTPEQVRLILVDPKMLELSIYDGIPHLLTEVVTDMKDAANALRWCVAEMDRRYLLMSKLGVRNLANANKKINEAIRQKQPIPDPLGQPNEDGEIPTLQPFPYVVVVIDELADMMMVVGKKVEELIARIAQKARAAGIHMILATQRPSVDVITGLIKSNIPTRIAFQVSSRVDSRTILDQQGAEHLLGHGDMLYLPPGTGVPIRVHGAFVDDHEVHNVVKEWKKRGTPQYIEAITLESDPSLSSGDFDETGESDPLYDEAVLIVTESRRASISNLQRRLKIGYNRAARIIEEMEFAGIVSPMGNNGNREVLAGPPPE